MQCIMNCAPRLIMSCNQVMFSGYYWVLLACNSLYNCYSLEDLKIKVTLGELSNLYMPNVSATLASRVAFTLPTL